MWPFSRRTRKNDFERARSAMSIDVSGAEFRDLYPTKQDIEARLGPTGLLSPEAVLWISETLQTSIAAGASVRRAMQQVVRSGAALPKEEKQSLGINPRMIVGDRFASAVCIDDIRGAIDTIEQIAHVATSRANAMHNLRRFEEAGIDHVTFLSCRDERDTEFERTMDGRRFTIPQARQLLQEHDYEMARSLFQAEVRF